MFWQTCQSENILKSDSSEYYMPSGVISTEMIDSFNKQADSLLAIHPDRSLILFRQALHISEKIDYNQGKLRALLRISDIYWEKTDLKNALDFANQAKELSLKIDSRKEYAEALLLIGKVYTDLGDYDKSSNLNFEALKVFEDENDKAGMSKALNRIGYVYFDQGNLDKALEYYSRSLKLAREINNLVGISRGLNNVSAVYGAKKEYDNVERNIREAIKINKKIGRKLWEGINYMNIGAVNYDMKNYDTAYFYYEKAISIFTGLNNITKLVDVYISMSKYFSIKKNFDKSLYYAKRAYKLARTNNLKKSIYVAAARLHDIYKEQNDLVNSYKYCLIEYQMKDSLDLEKSMTRLSQFELLYDFEKLTHKEKIEQQRKDYIYIISITVIVFLFIVTVILLKARQRIKAKNALIQKKQLEAEIEMKNKELTSNVMSLMRKNEILVEIADKLMDIRDEAVRDETKIAIKKIAGKLQKTTDSKIWAEFDTRFKQVHRDYYNKLLKRYPDLTPSEQRLCAFLRLNMSTKEISELTGQRINTIEVARTRLRKKLKITNTKVNLVSFLSKI